MKITMKKQLTVIIRKVTQGSDGKTYLTVEYPLACNYPSLVLKKNKTLKDVLEREKSDRR